ncbi:ferredoxin-type protein NapF [Pseudomonas sp.]|uniref:ferredoxin-type protein NapF n=1 Tax=Pseudomonas sp. TaxID=306 RepID=UPI001A0CCD91|nr:ferredoxin-type protein NapF [Pseudomonas sp.]MBF0674504.1 ferredoxin-type protein NapF [Pseudomonas sp.]
MDASRRRFFSLGLSVPGNRPPWAAEENLFIARCNRCNLCVEACPQQVLRVGSGGFPSIVFDDAGCTLCGDCVKACQPRALECDEARQPFPWRARIGTDCLPQRGVECRICAESCETGAIRFRPRLGGIAQPELDIDLCNGCGECIAPCPVSCITPSPLEKKPA